MKDRYLLDKFYELCMGIFLDEVADLEWAKLYTSKQITDEFNNYADIYTLEDEISEKVKKIEDLLTKKSRKSAIYLSDFSSPKNAAEKLTKDFGYIESFTDSLMVLDDSYELPDWESMTQVVHVGSDQHLLDELARVTKLSYSGEKSPGNPYGGIPMEEFIAATRKALENKNKINRIEAYLALNGKEYVACSVLLHDGKVGYICGVGSIPKARGRGFGKLVSQYASKRSRHLGCRITFLATEKGSRNEEFYRRIGYETKINGTCYVKGKSW